MEILYLGFLITACKIKYISGCLLRKNSAVPAISVLCRRIHGSDNRHKQDYYKVLGVNKNADVKEIKKAYYQVYMRLDLDADRS